MPELPEIEALREALAERFGGRALAAATVRQIALLKTFDPLLDDFVGRRLQTGRRRGKHLLLDFEGHVALAIHLGIGGRLPIVEPGAKGGRYISGELTFEDGGMLRVVELGTKKRSSLHTLRADQVESHLSHLGPDALSEELTVDRLQALLKGERAQLKRFLTDQRRIAGIGNAYSDEILWEARLAPLRMTPSLERGEISRLHEAIRAVLLGAIGRARSDNYLLTAAVDERGHFQVHRRPGRPCPRCGATIASIHYEESSLEYCPECQVEGRHYADRRLSRLLK